MDKEKIKGIEDYQYGFADKDTSIYKTKQGLTKETVLEISKIKNEPEWMRDFRVKAYETFIKMKNPNFGPNLEFLQYDTYTYYIKPADKSVKDWNDVPDTIRETFDRLGIPEQEKKFFAGIHTQYESESVYHNMLKEVEDKGVIFLDTDSALRMYPDLVKQYFNTVVPYQDNKFSALNGAVWSGGSFIYVPKGVKLDKPLQSYFRINSKGMGQFERTLIIVDEGADVHYVEGCTAPIYDSESLHAAVVEIIVKKGGKCRYSTVQNWSSNIVNLVTKRAYVEEDGQMEWIDGNIGSGVNMKYPACVLAGANAKGTCISIAVAGKDQFQDAGARMIHLAPNTSSQIISKSICRAGGKVNYRGTVHHGENAINARTFVQCDTLILDNISSSDTIPKNRCYNNKSIIEHEATVSKVSDEQLFYLMSSICCHRRSSRCAPLWLVDRCYRNLPADSAAVRG